MKSVGLKGFTIVELLIVVVVIAILASVTTAAYAGVSSQAHDAAVKSDLSILKKKIMMYKIENDKYPSTNDLATATKPLINAAKGSYAIRPMVDHNLLYCVDLTQSAFAFVAQSKSGKRFSVTNNAGVADYSPTGPPWIDTASPCAEALPGSPSTYNSRGYAGEDTINGPWRTWAGGN